MESSMFPSVSKQHLSEMRIILLGCEEGGKTSSGNTILGREAFELKKSAECIKKHGVVNGRQITVIDTPGRKRDYEAPFTPKLYREEVVRSVDHCPPGPHALLLVNRTHCPFEPQAKQAVEEHLKLFGENVWNHIIVLFTHVDQLEDKNIEKHIEEQGEPLQKLLEKCGNRYHVFNNLEKDDQQVKELMKKIEEMVDKNKGRYFEVDKTVLQGLIARRREQDERAKQRQMLTLRPKETLTLDLRIVLLGYQVSGKSTAGNTILGSDDFSFETIEKSVHKQASVVGREITAIDTPGWTKDGLFKDTPRKSKLEIMRSVSLCPPGPHAFLLVIPVDTTFTDANERSVIDHLGLLGEKVWSHVIVVFTHADWMGDTPIEMYIESEGEALQRLVDKCGNRYHALNNMELRSDGTQVRELLGKVEQVVEMNEGSHFKMDGNVDKMDYEDLQEVEKDMNKGSEGCPAVEGKKNDGGNRPESDSGCSSCYPSNMSEHSADPDKPSMGTDTPKPPFNTS